MSNDSELQAMRERLGLGPEPDIPEVTAESRFRVEYASGRAEMVDINDPSFAGVHFAFRVHCRGIPICSPDSEPIRRITIIH